MKSETLIWVLVACGLLGGCMTEPARAGFITLDDPLANGSTYASGIDGNNIVGYYTDSSRLVHGFIFDGATYTTLDDTSALYGTYATGIRV